MPSRVLVTGGCGFIGREVVGELVRHGHKVRVADNLSTPGSYLGEQLGVEFMQMDLRQASCALVALESVDICVALAARSGGIGFFNRLPGEILDDNLKIISATFEAARAHRISRIVYVSSSCVFDRSDAHPITEKAIKESPPPPSGYPFSKFVGETYCAAYLRQYQLAYTIVRPFNVYGPGENPGREPGESHVIPDLAQKVLMGQNPLEIFGDGSQTRSFTNVRDIARGIALAAESERALNEDINLGHPLEITIRGLAEKLWKICGRMESLGLKSLPAFQHDVRRRAVDTSKAKKLLGWEPQIGLDKGLADYVGWLQTRMAASRRSG